MASAFPQRSQCDWPTGGIQTTDGVGNQKVGEAATLVTVNSYAVMWWKRIKERKLYFLKKKKRFRCKVMLKNIF